jgi:hypothetical protein
MRQSKKMNTADSENNEKRQMNEEGDKVLHEVVQSYETLENYQE